MSEETKRISLEIDATLKGDELQSKLNEVYENVRRTELSFAGMKQGMADMPILGEMLNSQLQTTETLASTVGNKILALMKSEGDMTEETRARAINNLNASTRELSVLSDMQLGDQVFSARSVKQFSQSVSKSLATALDQILPQITNTIRTKINSPKAGEEKYSKIHSVADMQSQLIKDRDVMNIIRNNTPEGTMKQNAAAIRNYLGIAASRAMGYHRMNEFTQGMFGRNAGAFDSSRRELMDPREYLPEGFRSAYDAHGYVEKETHRPAQKVLSNSVRKAIISELNNNPVLYKAAERAQLIRKSADPNSRYGNYGDSLLIDDITDAQLDRFRKEAYKQLEVRGAGMGRYELENGIYYDPEDKSPRRRNTIASRFQTGTTRQAIEGLAFLDKLGDKDENFVRKKDVDRKELAGTRMIIQKKPMLDMYQISRAMPFLDDGSGHVTDKTTINESDITRMLRINQRGDRAKAYDMMSTISLDGYDPNNAEHRKILEQIYSKGIWVNRNTGEWQLNRPKDENGKADSNYLLHKFHAAHRGEDGAVLRMLNADEMRRIARETGARAKELGLEGNYLNMYSSDGVKEFGQLDKDGMFLANDKGKFFDAINKMYSPSRRIENNLQGKKVAVVDLGKMADGAGFASSELIRHSIQARGGSGFKGQLIPFYGKTMGDFLIRAGLAKKTLANGEADPNGAYHYWAKSINGEEMVDLMDADIVTDASLWKNAKRQFRNEKGEWYSADEINRRASALLGETSLSEMVDLDKESEANQLGTQLTSYMIINPKMRKMQLEGFRKRMAELETYEGMKKYVFANPETDEMAAELQKPGNESLLNTQRYRDRVNLYKQSLLHDVSTHKFIDFSEDAGDSFTNVTNSINPLSALLQGNEGGEIPKHILDTARDALNANRKPDQKEYTDEDVKDILLLRRSKGADGKEISNVIDYGTDDDYVAYARSPAAFGAFVYGRNRAKEMSIIENALTQRSADDPIVKQLLSATGTDDPLLHKGGVFLGQEDWKALSGADVDGDRVKRIRGIYADMIRESQENAEMLKSFSSQMDPEGNRRFGEMTLADIKTKTKIPNDVKAFIEDVERLMSEGKEMGIANAVALNPMQMKLDDLAGLNSRFILSARYGNKIYDEYASTFRKNPKQAINHGKEWWASLGIGRNFDAYLDHEDRLFQFDQDQLHAMDAYQEIKDQYERLDSDKSIPAKEFEQKQKELEKQLNAANKDLEKHGVFVSSRGDMLNLRAMGSEDDKAWGLNINMPSVNMDGHLSAMSMAKDAYRLGNVDLGRAESISEAMRYNIQQGNGVYADATDEIKDYASAYLQMFPQFSYGVRGNISDNELQDLRALRSKAIASVDEQIAERRAKEHISDTKAYFKNGESIAKYREKMLGKYYLGDSENAINVVENIDNFGFTTRNLERELRQDALQHFFNDPNVYLVGRNQTMMQQMQETKRIAEDATSQAAQQDIENIEAYESQPADNSAAQKANEEANKAETEATQAEVEAANARKEAAESRKKAAEAQKATAAKTEQTVQKAEQASEQQARHALDYAEYTVTRTMPWMDTDAVDKHGNPVVGLENIYVTKNGETVKGNLPVSLAPYTPRGQKKRTMEEGRKEQASSEKYGSSSSGADALIGSSISHVMDELGPSAVTNTIYGGGFREMEERAYRSLKEFYTKHEAEMKQLGITFNDADMSSFDPTKSNFSYSGKDAKILDKLNALTPSRLASYFVDDIVRQGRDRNGALFATDDTRTIISTEGKIYDPIMGNVLNESTMVAGPSGGEKEIGYTLKGIKNSKGEDVVTRFAPDYIVRDGKTGKIVIGDHKSSPHGADKGIIQGSIYAAWLDDLAEEYYKTTDAQRKRDLDPYKIFGQLNDKGEYESNIIGIETRDFFSNITDRREYNQDIRRKESERIRKAQDKKYAEAKENFGKYGLDDIPVVPPSDSNPPSGGNPPAGNNPPPDDAAQRAIADRQREAYYQEYQLLINQFSQLKEAHEGYSSGMRSEMYKDREGTYADNYFRRSIFGKNKVIEENDDLIKQFRELYAKTGKEDYVGVINSLNEQSNDAREAFVSGTRAFAQNRSKRLLENAENFDLRKHDPFFKQREEIENQNNAVKEMESTLDNFILSRFDQSEISRDKNTREVNGILQGGKLVNVRDAELENEDDRNTVSLMKKRLESLKTAADENIQLINDQIERDVDKEIAAMQESSDATTKTHQTSGQQRKNYWDKKRRKIDDSIKDAILSRDAIDKMLEDTETYKEDDPKRKQLERLRDQYNKSIAQESEYLNEGGFDNDRKEDLQKQRVSRLNQLRHYFSGTHESRVAQMASTGMLALKDLDNSGDILNVGNQFYQGMSRMIDDTIGTEKARYTNIVADLSRTGSMSAQERINRSYQSKKLQSLASIRQMDQEAIDLDKMLKTGLDLDGNQIFDPEDNSKTTAGIKEKIENYRDFLKDLSKQAKEALDKVLPDQKEKDISRAIEDIKATSELREDRYKYGADQILRSDNARRRQVNAHLQNRNSAFSQELLWRQNQYDSAVAREQKYTAERKQLDIERTNLQRRLDDDDANGRQLSKAERTGIENELAAATEKYNALTEAIGKSKEEQEEFGSSGQKVAAALTVIGGAITKVAKQFGVRIFRKAMQEAMNFVKSYDAAMTEIQMVTLKTDAQISNIGKGLIDSAVQLKAPIADVTAAATALYRQGLGDEEVQTRLQDVIKFSTTAGVKAADAVKLITVSLNSGLVSSSREAMDVISALGDSAATTAAEITKGLQKSVYAAKDVGVTYNELVSMLTAITAGTQLGGNIAGTAMQTFMSRFSKIGTNELVYDENGNQMSGSALASVLQSVGIKTYEGGERRRFTDVLSELAGQWGDLSDARKSQISYAFGGTRQYSNLNALLTAFGEVDENGQTAIEKYLGIAKDSEGMTDAKYQSYTESLAASINTLKNSFDGLVESLTNTNVLTGFIDFISNAIAGITELNTALGGVPAILIAIGGALTVLTAANPTLLAIAGVVAGVAAVGNIAHNIATSVKANSDPYKNFKAQGRAIEEENTLRAQQIRENLTTARELNQKRLSGKKLTDGENNRLIESLGNLQSLGVDSIKATTNINALAASAQATAKALDGVTTSASALSDRQVKELLNAFLLDVENGEEQFQESKAKITISEEERTEALEAIENAQNNESTYDYSFHDAIAPILDAIDLAGLNPVTIDGKKNTPNNFTSDQLARGIFYAKYFSKDDLASLGISDFDPEEFSQLIEIIDSVLSGNDDAGRLKNNSMFGEYRRDGIKELVTQSLTGTEYSDIIDDVIESVISDANQAENFNFLGGDIRRYAARYRQEHPNAGVKNIGIDAFFGGAASSLAPESYNSENFDNLYEWMAKRPRLADRKSVISELHGQVKLGKNGAFPFFESLLQDTDFSKALLRFATENEDGTYTLNDNISEEDFNYFMRTIASKGTKYQIANYRNNADILHSAQSAITSLEGGKKWSDLTEDAIKDVTTVLGEEYTSRLAKGQSIDSTLLNNLYSNYLNNVSPYSQVGYAKLGQNLLSNIGAPEFTLKGWQEKNNLTQADMDSIFQLYNGLKEVASMTDEELEAGGYNPEEIKKGAEKTLNLITTLANIGESDWSDMSKNAITKFNGTYAEQLSEYSNLISQNDTFNEAKKAIERVKDGKWLETDLSTLQSLTGIKIDFKNVDTAIDDVESVYNTLVTNFSNGLNETLMNVVSEETVSDIKIEKPTLNTSELVGYLGNSVEEWVKRAIEDLGIAMQNGEFVYDVEDLNQVTATTVAGIMSGYNNNQTSKNINILSGIRNALKDEGNTSLDEELSSFSADDLAEWFKNNPVAAELSTKVGSEYSNFYSRLIDGMINPQENKGVAYNQDLLRHYIDRMNKGQSFDIVNDAVDKFIYDELASAYGADFTNMFKNGYNETIANNLLTGVSSFRTRQQAVDNVRTIVSDIVGGRRDFASLSESSTDLNDLNAIIPENIRGGLFGDGSVYAAENRDAILERLYSQYLTGQGMNNYDIANYAKTMLDDYENIRTNGLQQWGIDNGLLDNEIDTILNAYQGLREFVTGPASNTNDAITKRTLASQMLSNMVSESDYSDLTKAYISSLNGSESEKDALLAERQGEMETYAEVDEAIKRIESGNYSDTDLATVNRLSPYTLTMDNVGSYLGLAKSSITRTRENKSSALIEALNTLYPNANVTDETILNNLKALGIKIEDGKFVTDEAIQTPSISSLSSRSSAQYNKEAVDRNSILSQISTLVNQSFFKEGYEGSLFDLLPDNSQFRDFFKNQQANGLINELLVAANNKTIDQAQFNNLFEGFINPNGRRSADYYASAFKYYRDQIANQDTVLEGSFNDYIIDMLTGTFGETFTKGRTDSKLTAEDTFFDMYLEIAKRRMDKYSNKTAYNKAMSLLDSYANTPEALLQSDIDDMTRPISRAKDEFNNYDAQQSTSAIASVLGWSQDTVKEKMQTDEGRAEVEEAIKKTEETTTEAITMLIDTLRSSIAAAFNVSGDSVEEVDGKIAEVAGEIGQFFAQLVEKYGHLSIDPEADQTYSELYDEFIKNRSLGSQRDIFGFAKQMKENGQTFSNVTATEGTNEDAYIRALLGDKDYMNMFEANQRNILSDSAFDTYLSNRQNGTDNQYSVYSNILDNLLGGGVEGGFLGGLEKGTISADTITNTLSAPDNTWIRDYIESLSGGKEALEAISRGGENAKNGIDQLAAAMRNAGASAASDYRNDLTEMTNILNDLKKGGQDAGKAMGQLSKKLYDAYDNILASNRIRGKSGKQVDKTTRGIVGEFLGISDDKQIQKMTKDQMNHVADLMESSGKDAINNGFVKTFEDELKSALNALDPGSEQYEIVNDILVKAVADGEVDSSELDAVIAALQNDVLSSMNAAMGPIGTLMLSIFASGNSITAALTGGAQLGTALLSGAKANVNLNTGNKAKYQNHGGGGGGGGGKSESAAEKLVNRAKKGEELYSHQLKMIQYDQTKHQNAGELTMYGNELQREIDLEKAYLPALQKNINAMKSEMNSVSKGSEDWYKLREALFHAEEQYAEISNTIKDNEQKLKENREAIRQTRIALEDLLTSQIEERIKKQRDMLAGTVDMQSIILDAIRQRYQDEWDLVKKDIEKKKQALEEEKSLIDERLNLRKNAADEAKKYEELAELKSQLARVSMDSTRTKDAAALREQIAKIEEEIGWDIADQQAESEKQQIDDQIKGYDEYMSQGDEDLSKFLEDTNNFAQEVTSVLEMSHDELFAWLRNNVTDFKNSLDEVQQQMIDSWDDTYKQMFGITDTYWEQINAILSDKDTFLNFMRESDEYVNASETEKQSLIYEWEKLYDDYVKARLNGPVGSHSDNGLGDWYGSEYTGADGGGGGGSGGSGGGPSTPTSNEDEWLWYAVDQRGKVISAGYAKKEDAEAIAKREQGGRVMRLHKSNASTEAKVNTAVYSITDPIKATANSVANSALGSTVGSIVKTVSNATSSALSAITNSIGKLFKPAKADTGAYTGNQEGLIYVHKKERILNPQQTESFERLTRVAESMDRTNAFDGIVSKMNDWSSNTVVPIDMPSFSPSDFKNSTTTTIGDIIITLNEAKLENDADYEAVAQRVGEKFVKELTKQGLGVSAFGF